jgi:hypothetical protein
MLFKRKDKSYAFCNLTIRVKNNESDTILKGNINNKREFIEVPRVKILFL